MESRNGLNTLYIHEMCMQANYVGSRGDSEPPVIGGLLNRMRNGEGTGRCEVGESAPRFQHGREWTCGWEVSADGCIRMDRHAATKLLERRWRQTRPHSLRGGVLRHWILE